MATAENFETMITNRPKDALKYVREFIQSPVWNYIESKIYAELKSCDNQLRECPLEQILMVRGYIKGVEYFSNMPSKLIDALKDEIVIQKDAAKVEEARQPDNG